MKRILLSMLGVIVINASSFSQVGNYNVGDVVANFTVTDVHGQSHTLYDYTSQGKLVLLDFFFTTCPPCIATVPYFTEFYNKYGCNEGDIVVLAIDNGDSDAEVLQYEVDHAGTNPAPAASGNDGGGNAVNAQFGISAYPTYCLIGADNQLKNGDIWPVNSIVELENAVSNAGFTINPQSCSASLINNDLAMVEMNVYPNPAKQTTNISINSQTAYDATLRLLDFQGRVVLENVAQINSGNTVLNLNLDVVDNGQYILQLKEKDRLISTSKLVVYN